MLSCNGAGGFAARPLDADLGSFRTVGGFFVVVLTMRAILWVCTRVLLILGNSRFGLVENLVAFVVYTRSLWVDKWQLQCILGVCGTDSGALVQTAPISTTV